MVSGGWWVVRCMMGECMTFCTKENEDKVYMYVRSRITSENIVDQDDYFGVFTVYITENQLNKLKENNTESSLFMDLEVMSTESKGWNISQDLKPIDNNLKSDIESTEIVIEDDGHGYPRDILSKIGEPYLRSNSPQEKSKTGLGLGLFIGKILLEKNFASVNCRNSKTRGGAEVTIKWKNKDLFNI